jgi:hypothetical protein
MWMAREDLQKRRAALMSDGHFCRFLLLSCAMAESGDAVAGEGGTGVVNKRQNSRLKTVFSTKNSRARKRNTHHKTNNDNNKKKRSDGCGMYFAGMRGDR